MMPTVRGRSSTRRCSGALNPTGSRSSTWASIRPKGAEMGLACGTGEAEEEPAGSGGGVHSGRRQGMAPGKPHRIERDDHPAVHRVADGQGLGLLPSKRLSPKVIPPAEVLSERLSQETRDRNRTPHRGRGDEGGEHPGAGGGRVRQSRTVRSKRLHEGAGSRLTRSAQETPLRHWTDIVKGGGRGVVHPQWRGKTGQNAKVGKLIRNRKTKGFFRTWTCTRLVVHKILRNNPRYYAGVVRWVPRHSMPIRTVPCLYISNSL